MNLLGKLSSVLDMILFLISGVVRWGSEAQTKVLGNKSHREIIPFLIICI